MTPFVAKELASSHWYDLRGAREDLGYAPAVSGTEGFARTVAYFKAHPPA
jgi:nucleoside-diphosphate-sugar epimerase